jgi:hypothetical protein
MIVYGAFSRVKSLSGFHITNKLIPPAKLEDNFFLNYPT